MTDVLTIDEYKNLPLPEHNRESQVCIILYKAFSVKYPDLEGELSHFPAGEFRTKSVAAKLKAMGVPKGRSDYDLLIRRAGYPGLFLEVKPLTHGAPSPEQIEFLASKRAQGYYAAVGYGVNNSMMILSAYVEDKLDEIEWFNGCDTRADRRKAKKEATQ